MADYRIRANTNFALAGKLWWHADHTPRAEESVVRVTAVQKYIKEQMLCICETEKKEAEDVYRLYYATECLVSEGQVPKDFTTQDLHEFLEEGIEKFENPRVSLKVRNVKKVVDKFFPSVLQPPFPPVDLTVDLIRNIHRDLMCGLIDNAGDYRRKDAMPSAGRRMDGQEFAVTYKYLAYEYIPEALESLVLDTQKRMSQCQTMEDAIKLAASFLLLFLHIHPFSNGNGRTARILVSVLLMGFSVVPVILYSWLNRGPALRGVYLECLEKARRTQDPKDHRTYDASMLARFLLDNIQISQDMVCQLLCIEENMPV